MLPQYEASAGTTRWAAKEEKMEEEKFLRVIKLLEI